MLIARADSGWRRVDTLGDIALNEACVPCAAGVAEDGLRCRSAPPLRRFCTGTQPMSELQSS